MIVGSEPAPALVRARAVTRALSVAGALTVAATFTSALVPRRLYRPIRPLVDALDLAQEANVGTWFSAAILLLCSALLFLVGLARKQRGLPDAPRWLLLAGVFVLLSADEVGGLHEQLSGALRRRYEPTGLLYHAWVVPGAAFVAAVGASCYRILDRLTAVNRRLFLLAGLLYVGGGLGFEMLGGFLATTGGAGRRPVPWVGFLEESLELSGAILFTHTLLRHAALERATLAFLEGGGSRGLPRT